MLTEKNDGTSTVYTNEASLKEISSSSKDEFKSG